MSIRYTLWGIRSFASCITKCCNCVAISLSQFYSVVVRALPNIDA